jgi:hypothetical protein
LWYLLEVGLVVLLPCMDDLAEVVDEPQLPRVLLVNFLPNKISQYEKKNKKKSLAREERLGFGKREEAHTFSDASLMQLWKRTMTWSRLRRLCCGAAKGGASEAARERRRTDAARAAARARSSWSSLEPSGNAGGGSAGCGWRGGPRCEDVLRRRHRHRVDGGGERRGAVGKLCLP